MNVLMPCPVCDKQVSDAAETCPGCGHPLKARGSEDRMLVKIVLGIVLAALVVWMAIRIVS